MEDKILSVKSNLLISGSLAFLYLVFIYLFDYKFIYIMQLSSILFFCFYFRFKKEKILFTTLLYLVLFDNDNFCFTVYNLRIWYFFLIPVLFYFIKYFHKMINLENTFVVLLLILSIIAASNDGPSGFLFLLKYLIYIILIYSFVFLSLKLNICFVCNVFLVATSFIHLYGIVQFLFNLNHIFIFTYSPDLRPHAFFSETTWFSQFIIFGIFLSAIISKKIITYKYLLLFYLLSIIISVSRNSILSFIFGFLIYTFLMIKEKTVNFKSIAINMLLIPGLVFFTIYLLDSFHLYELFIYKFYFVDHSALGRLEAFELSIDLIQKYPLTGIGFLQSIIIDNSGTTIGSKSFSLFFMIFHVLGVFGFIIFLLLISTYYIKILNAYFKSKKINYNILISLLFMSIFLISSQFAPIHQYSFGMLIIAYSIILFNKRDDHF